MVIGEGLFYYDSKKDKLFGYDNRSKEESLVTVR